MLPALHSDSIAGYELLGERHRGGQGVVYEAMQVATKRRVAIKMLHESPQAPAAAQRARFEREVEILSQLRHPHVVTVHDSGVTHERLYYVMDFVEGQRFDDWIASRRGEIEGRRTAGRLRFAPVLGLFLKICDAVNAAHIRGVIHRDLKPANILIDSAGEPRVLDFGLAKLQPDPTSDVTNVPSMTEQGQFVGSLPWSSPEQAGGEVDRIDTRTDVYALGVLLYQALTGCFPYRVTGNPAEVVQQIRSTEPTPMNRPVWPAGPVADLRKPIRWSGHVDDELETIVRKCLQKDSERRYQTAGELKSDLERYLRNEPVEAKRDSVAYVTWKLLRRHRFVVGATAAFLLACTVGFAVSLYYWKVATVQLEQSKAATRLLQGMFGHTFNHGFSQGFSGKDVTVSEVLDTSADDTIRKAQGRPELEAMLNLTVGDAYLNLGKMDRARKYLDRALEIGQHLYGESDPAYGFARFKRAELHHAMGEYPEAEQGYRAALQMCQTDEAEARRVRAMAQFGLSNLLEDMGRAEEGETLAREAVAAFREMPDERVKLASSIRVLAGRVTKQRRFDEAGTLYEEATSILVQEVGEDHPAVAVAWNDYAEFLRQTDHPREAAELFEKALAVFRRAFGDDSPKVATCTGSLGVAYLDSGQLKRAAEYLTKALAARRHAFPPGHLDIGIGASNLASYYRKTGNSAAAVPLYREALAILSKSLPPTDPYILDSKVSLATSLIQGRDDSVMPEAERLLVEALEVRRQDVPAGSMEIGNIVSLLGAARMRQEHWADAEPVLRETVEIRSKNLPAGSWEIGSARMILGEALLGQSKLDLAEEALLEAYRELKAAPNAPARRIQDGCKALVRLYAARKDAAKVEEWKAILNETP